MSAYIWLIAVFGSPAAALLGCFVVVWLTQDVAVGVIAGIAGLVVGLVVGFVIAAFLERDEQRAYESATRARRTWPNHADEDKREELDELDRAMEELFDTARREHRDLTPAEEREVERLVAMQNEAYQAEHGEKWPSPTELAYFLTFFFGAPVTALVVTLMVGWLLAG